MTPRLLFVDDEPRVLEGLENALFEHLDEWEMSFAESGAEAIELLAGGPFDVIVTDMRMPGIDGPELLEHVREHHPEALRVVLSGHAELDAVMRAFPIAHQFIGKPCKNETLRATLEHSVKIAQTFTDNDLRRSLGRLAELPARERIHQQITRLLDQPEVTHADLARVLSRDLAITGKVMQVASSVVFSRGAHIKTLEQAIGRMGTEALRMLVCSFEIQRSFELPPGAPLRTEQLNLHSVEVARRAAALVDRELASEAFLVGLLHDMGALVFAAHVTERYAACLSGSPERVLVAERREFGIDHAQVGGYVAELWNLDPEIVEAVACHHAPWEAADAVSRALARAVAEAEAEAEADAPPALRGDLDGDRSP